jgi:hypothetical protein
MTERERYSVVLHLIALCVGLLVGCGWIYRVVISTDILLEPDFRMTIISVTGFLCVVLPVVITIALGVTLLVVLGIKKVLLELTK